MSLSRQISELHKSRRSDRMIHIAEFIADRLEPSEDAEILLSVVFKDYEAWTVSRGIYRWGIDGLATAFHSEGIEVGTIRNDSRRYLKGYVLR